MCVRLIALLLLTAASLLSQAQANADIIRCGDANGDTLFTDTACPPGMRNVGARSFAQTCTEDCARRRERDLKEAQERLRAEKEELAAYTATRHKQEIEDRWLDEARYEAELRDGKAGQTASNDEGLYPVYPLIGFRSCGLHCLAFPHHRPHSLMRISDIDRKHHHMKNPNERRGAAGNEPRHLHRGTVPSGRLAINVK
jgi:uncharacterized protein DUF4124